ncbi:unnamed protein product, partial [Polarella glacialis]
VAMYCPDSKPQDFPGAEAIHLRGFFIGVHQVQVEDSKVQQLADLMLKFEFQPQRVVLVTGAGGMLGKYVRSLVEERNQNGHGDADVKKSSLAACTHTHVVVVVVDVVVVVVVIVVIVVV